uniref:Uncharacterized protein n=1 Tax=viral metagenome TaxID=1070528 RepID=A0A6M3J9S6_9ZZZZ
MARKMSSKGRGKIYDHAKPGKIVLGYIQKIGDEYLITDRFGRELVRTSKDTRVSRIYQLLVNRIMGAYVT